MKKQKILTVIVDKSQSQTGGTKLAKEASSALKTIAGVIEKEWKKDFNWLSRRSYIFGSLEICKWLYQERPHAFYCDSRMFSIIWLAVIMAKLLNIPFITTLQASHHLAGGRKWQGVPGKIRFLLLKSVCRNADIVISNSSVTRSLAIEEFGIEEGRVKTVWPGFEPDQDDFSKDLNYANGSKDDNKLRILCISRYTWLKGVDVLINALRILKRPVCETIIIGERFYDDAGEKYWQSLVSLAGEARIDMRGKANKCELNGLCQWADVVVVPSRHEAFGIVVLEALYNGVPVIASNALPWEIRNISDWIFSFKNEDAKELASTIKRMSEPLFKRRKKRKVPLLAEEQWNWKRFQKEFTFAISGIFHD